MKRTELIPLSGEFYKANLHSHTTHSDGKMTPAQSKQEHMKRGYSVVAFTDHEVYVNHEELNDENFVAIAAYEVDINKRGPLGSGYEATRTYHINLYDRHPNKNKGDKTILPEQRYDDIDYINSFIADMDKKGFMACYNHPYWSLQDSSVYTKLKGLWGMEIYNHGCEVEGLYGYNPQSYDEMLRSGQKLFCVSTDDNHNWYPFESQYSDSFGGFTMIKSEKLDYDSIIDALEKGNFYSSMGPEIEELYIEGNKLVIKCSPVEKICVSTMSRRCYYKAAEPGKTIDKAEFELSGKDGYIRVTCRDEKGLYANTNAYFVDDIVENTEK